MKKITICVLAFASAGTLWLSNKFLRLALRMEI